MGQKSDKLEQKFVESDEQLSALFYDNKLSITNCFMVNEDMLQVALKQKVETTRLSLKTQVVLASMITGYARVRLHQLLMYLIKNQCTCMYSDFSYN